MATLSQEQFQLLLNTITANAAPPAAAPAAPPAAPQQQKDPNALGPMHPCVFTTDKMSRLTQFEAWLEEAENLMKFLNLTVDDDKLIYIRSWGGQDLVKFMKLPAKIKFEVTPAVGNTAAIPADTYDQAIEKVKAELRKLVNRTMAMYQLLSKLDGLHQNS